ncbi:MAG: riboflavin biosynthesis protein RibF [Eggerthellaceae bacterium]|nr:riboflavin biosynthesis protein RibF [Eggerthellaceae bacterium]
MAEIVTLDIAQGGDFFAGTSCVFGVFDGFHVGHQLMVAEALATKPEGERAIAITFDIDPDEVFAPNRLKKILTNEDRLAALAASGVDAVAVLPFSREFAALSPEAFLEAVFGEGAPAFVHVGVDFAFGRFGSGHVDDMRAWGEPRGMTVVGHELFRMDDGPITATRIRGLLAEGRVGEANRLLGRPYALSGNVVHGRGSGAVFGIPTANLDVRQTHICVGDGVYGCRAEVDGAPYNAAVCIGIPPTFEDEAKQQVEVHLIDFDGDLYGRDLRIEFLQFIRPNRVFSGIDELVATLRDNIATIRATQPL